MTANSPVDPIRDPSRRTVLKVAGAGGLAAATITFVGGCGNAGGEEEAPPGVDVAQVQAAVRQAAEAGQVPVGGATVLEDAEVVVSQPTEGDYRVFSNYCPHQGGRVTRVDDERGWVICVLHGSAFDQETGEVAVGPSARGLTPIDVEV